MLKSLFSLRKAVAGCAIAACLTLLPPPSHAQDDPPSEAGRLSIVNGTVSIQPAGSDDWEQAYLNYALGPGDRIFTDSDGRAEVQIGQTFVRIGPNSDVSLVDVSPDAISFGIGQGALRLHSNGLWPNQSLYVQTPNGSATLSSPGDFRVDVMADDQTAIVTDNIGDVYLSGAGDFGLQAQSGQAVQLVGTNPVYPQWLQPAYPDDLDNWSHRRDAQIQAAVSFHYVSPDIPGAYELDAYGQWTPGTEYGAVWFPNVQAGWSPYHNGHWVNRQPWGWIWVEDEPWGYAPFHYGRWVNMGGRWGWIPGSPAEHPVWSPALVAFAGGISFGGGGVSVWFPLGPGEPYRPPYRCSPRYIDRVNITNIRESRNVHVQNTYVNIVNINNTTNITNITYVNRTNGATAMRQQDFASGRSVAQSAVRVDPRQMDHAQVLARPIAVAPSRPIITRPVARPVPVTVARPVLINNKGMAVAARPNATPVAPPVRATPVPRILPGRTVVAPPPNVKMTPTAERAIQNRPPSLPAPPQNQIRPVQGQAPQQPLRPNAPNPQAPVQGGGAPPHLSNTPPAAPNAPRQEAPQGVHPNPPAQQAPPAAPPQNQNRPVPPAQQFPPNRPVVPPQDTRPLNQPPAQPTPPAPRPAPPQDTRQQYHPPAEPAPQTPPRPAQPASPTQPAPRPAPPQDTRPQYHPVEPTPQTPQRPPQPAPPTQPAPRPAPPQENRPQYHPPTPPPEPRPNVRPETPPPSRPAPPPQARPNTQAPPPAAQRQPQPPPDKNRKPEKKEENKPQ